jgi:hypothetical protein
MWRKIFSNCNGIKISLILNVDGKRIIGNRKIYPLYLAINELGKLYRYKYKNILVPLIWINDVIDYKIILHPIINELKLIQNGVNIKINGIEENFIIRLHCISLDLAERFKFFSMSQWNGYTSCLYCFQRGIFCNHTVYFKLEETVERTVQSFLEDSLSGSELSPVNGIIGVSPITELDYFNFIEGTSVDILHNMGIGIIPHVFKFIGKEDMESKIKINGTKLRLPSCIGTKIKLDSLRVSFEKIIIL